MFSRSKNSLAVAPKANPSNSPTRASGKGVVPSVISADLHVLGNIISDGFIDIDGKIEGNVKCRSATVRPNGLVRGDIQADIIHVYGRIEGMVKARNVSLYASARVQGTIMHESLSIEDGAFVDGKFKRTDKVFIDDEATNMDSGDFTSMPLPSFGFDNDNRHEDEESSDDELRMLENLRLIS